MFNEVWNLSISNKKYQPTSSPALNIYNYDILIIAQFVTGDKSVPITNATI